MKSDSYSPNYSSDLYSDSWAVLIGVNKFQHSNMSAMELDVVTHDIDEIKKTLTAHCDYSDSNIFTIIGRKATRDGIKRIFDTDLSEKINEDDRLLIYYSGHGMSREKTARRPEKGYLTTYDTRFRGKKLDWQTMLEMDEFMPYIEARVSAKQILFLLDCCFSGMVQKPLSYTTHNRNLTPEDMCRMAKNAKSRQAYTAGGRNEEIRASSNVNPPISIFVEALTRTLETANPLEYKENFLAASKLALKVTEQVRATSINLSHVQHPDYYYFNTDTGGEFVFKPFSDQEINAARLRPTLTYEPIEDLIKQSGLMNLFTMDNITAINRYLEKEFPYGYSLLQLQNAVNTIFNNEEGNIVPYVEQLVMHTPFSRVDVLDYIVMNTLAIGLYRNNFKPELIDVTMMEADDDGS